MKTYKAGTNLAGGRPWRLVRRGAPVRGITRSDGDASVVRVAVLGLSCFCRVDYDGEGGRLRDREGQADAREGNSAAMSLKSDLHRHGEEVLSLGW